MSGHVKWTDFPFSGRKDWERINKAARTETMIHTRAWVQGYILALEDVIKDLEVQLHGYLNDPDAQHVLEMTLEKVQGTLMSAQRTLDMINETMEEKQDDQQG